MHVRNPDGTALAETVSLLEALVGIPTYAVKGATKNRVVYYSEEGGSFSIWAFDPTTGKKRKLTTEPIVSDLWALPRQTTNDYYYIRDTAKGLEKHKIYKVDCTKGEEALSADVPEMRITGLAFHLDLVAFTAASRDSTGLYTSKSGTIEKRSEVGAFTFVMDADERTLAGMGTMAGNTRSFELFFFNQRTGQMNVFTPEEGSVNKGPVLRGSQALFESNFSGANDLYVHNLDTGETIPAPLGFSDQRNYHPTEHPVFDWTNDGKVYCIGKKDGQAKGFIDGKEVRTPPGYLSGMALFAGKAYFSHSTFVQPYRILEADPRTGGSTTVIDNQLPPALRTKTVRSRLVKYKSQDGLEIAAFVADDGAAKRKRTVTYIHGGPWGEVFDHWLLLPNMFLALGYNVIAPNYRGSTGYGEDFRNMDIGDPGGMDFVDMASAARWAKENIATEVALAGYSYGGYSTLYGLGKEPDLWHCGAAGAPIADWKEMYEMSDAAFKGFAEVLFDKKMELLSERSPITYVNNVRKPLCIISSQNDSRTPIMPVLRYVTALQANGAKFEFHCVPDMGHEIRTTKDRMDIALPMATFLLREFQPA